MTSYGVTIRDEAHGDESAITALLQASFPSSVEARLVGLLRDAGRLTVSLVAEVDGRVVGHVGFSPVTTTAGQNGIGLAPVAVLPEYRQCGIAAELIRAGLHRCQSLQHGWCVVLGEPTYYARFGFRPASAFGLNDEYGGGEAFQIVELSPGSIPIEGGLVQYVPEFAVVV